MARYLVTGGSGFIGSHLVDALCAQGHGVRILDNLSSGTLAHKPPEAEFVLGDVADPVAVADALDGIDGCFHLAAVASVERCNAEWVAAHRTNLTGTVTLFDAARRKGAGRPIPVVFASSAAVYGENRQLPLSESAVPQPQTAYAADKLGCELHAGVAGRIHRIPNCGLRFFNVYGPRQDPRSPYSGVISIFASRVKEGCPVTINGDGGQTRDFVFVGDVVRALLAAMVRCALPGEVVNVCTGAATAIRQLAGLIAEIAGTRLQIAGAPERAGDIRSSVGDPSAARRSLGFAAEIDLRTGLARTLGQT